MPHQKCGEWYRLKSSRNVRRHQANKPATARPASERPRGVWIVAAALSVPLFFLPYGFDPFLLPKQLAVLLVVAAMTADAFWSGGRPPSSRLIRWGLVALLTIELLSFAAAQDRLGAITGNLGYRLGVLSHVTLLLVFAGTASVVRSHDDARWLLRWGFAMFLGVFAYGLVQFAGRDPFKWALDSGAVFSSIGNPNDCAGYALLSVGGLGALASLRGHTAPLLTLGCMAAIGSLVIMTDSRSGLMGFGVVLVALPLFALLNRWPGAEIKRLAVILGAPSLMVAGFALASGRASLIEARFEQLLRTSPGESASVQTRTDIWRGTWAVVMEHPIFGVGPDGLLVSFNRTRPPGLGPPFSELSSSGYDPLVGSAHNFLLDVLVTLGIPGLVAVLAVTTGIVVEYWRQLRFRRSTMLPFVGAGVTGYGAFILFNPLSLPSLLVLAVLLGAVVGCGNSIPVVALRLPFIRRVAFLGSLGFAGVVFGFAGLALWADHEAFAAAEAASRGNDSSSVYHSRRAAQAVPFESAYRRQEVQALLNFGFSSHSVVSVEEADIKQRTFLSDFPGFASDFLTLARIRMALGAPGVATAIDAAEVASPRGRNTAAEIASLRARPEPGK